MIMNKRLLYILLALFAVSIATTAKTYLISIGVSRYANNNIAPNLNLPEADADTIANVFSDDDCECVVLKNEKATGANILSAAQELFAKATKKDKIIFFFSGHGNGVGFCAHDYGVTSKGTVSFNDVRSLFHASKARGKIMMADACYSGKIRTPELLPDSVSKALQKQQQVMLFLSSRGNETSMERSDMPNGFFTTYLAQGLRGAADTNHNGKITAGEISSYVSLNVREESNGEQHSNIWGNFNLSWIIKKVTPQ